jgi:AP2 domain/HNH endonuclease
MKINGGETLLDDEDVDWLSAYYWFKDKQGYARRVVYERGKKTTRLMHRDILKISDHKIHVDHINLNKLDNRKCNLRLATRAQNSQNRPVLKNNLLGIKGVRLYERTGRFVARIRVCGKLLHLGYFNTPEEASDAYWRAAQNYFGEFARK